MGSSRWFFSVAAALVLTASVHAVSDVTWFHGRDVIADFESFLGTSGDFDRTFMGKTEAGKPCRFIIAKKGKQIVFTPGIPVVGVTGDYKNNKIAQAKSFVVSSENLEDLNGGFEGNKLWSSYFIDRDRDLVIHGQFGVSFNLELEKNDQGKLTRFEFRKTRQEDLGYFPLGSLSCILTP